jgi:methyl-accepting chemotaxis protein
VSAVEKVSQMMRDISSAAQEQTSGIEQVNTAVSQMDEMTQQNAALVEEASAAGEAMAEQARNMSVMMEFFTTSHRAGDTDMRHREQRPAPAGSARGTANSAYGHSGHSHASGNGYAPRPPVSRAADSADEWEDF